MIQPIRKPCRHPACRQFALDHGYCPAHQPMSRVSSKQYDETTRKNDPALAWAKHVRNSTRWQKIRAMHKAQNPCCADPFKLHGEYPPLGSITNHITPLRQCFESGRQEMAYEWSNLSTLCTSCDSRIGAMERKGEPTEHLFAHCNNESQSIGFA